MHHAESSTARRREPIGAGGEMREKSGERQNEHAGDEWMRPGMENIITDAKEMSNAFLLFIYYIYLHIFVEFISLYFCAFISSGSSLFLRTGDPSPRVAVAAGSRKTGSTIERR